MELSVIVVRSVNGEISTFPTAENIHHNNILFQSIVPARVEKGIQQKVADLAVKLADELNLVGPLAVEMFLTEDGELLVNELAPRPHNSGHYTLDLCESSQFGLTYQSGMRASAWEDRFAEAGHDGESSRR